MEAETALRLLLERLPGLGLDPGFRISYLPDLIRHPETLPVTW